MADMKRNHDDTPPIIMASEPMAGCSTKQLRKIILEDESESTLASVYAGVFNQTGWLMHDLDDEDCTDELRQRYQEWSALEEELRNRIFDILKRESIDEFEKLAAQNNGYYDVVKPFMVRNGYKDGRGWWVKGK